MLFVLFAVVLILPAFQGERFLSAASGCLPILIGGSGDIYCQLSGYSRFLAWYPGSCELGCEDGSKKVPLPRTVCPSGSLDACTPTVQKKLQDWSVEMHNKKNSLVRRWCSKA